MKDLINYFTQHVFVRYLIAGGSTAAVNLALFFVFNNLLSIHYLTASALAFLAAFVMSFTLHKFWTFKSHIEETHKQAMKYFAVSLCSLVANECLMYVFVHFLRVPAFYSQILVQALLACCTFFISHRIIFKYKNQPLSSASASHIPQ